MHGRLEILSLCWSFSFTVEGVGLQTRTGGLSVSLLRFCKFVYSIYRFDDMDIIFASPADFQALKSRDRKKGLHLLEHFVERCHQIGAWIKSGDAKEVICNEVRRVRPDLMVMGCRGLGPFHRVFVGTVSEFFQKHAECHIITIKRK
ncbi:hypothetical protein MKX03_029008 [Papaver bracteatum]|nr:hypothetical protein MKX03_029008 [Papaver bracteatum]